MGYWGLVILARTVTRLDELPRVENMLVTVTDNRFADDWRLGFLGEGDDVAPEAFAAQIVAETGFPAIALYVCDRDFAVVAAASPAGPQVGFVLNERMYLAYQDGDDDFGLPVTADAIEPLLAWAVDAGLVPDRDRLVSTMAASPGPFGAGIGAFAEALGALPIRQ